MVAFKGVTGFGSEQLAPGVHEIVMFGSKHKIKKGYTEGDKRNSTPSSNTSFNVDSLDDLDVAPHYKGKPQGGLTQKIDFTENSIMIDGKPATFDLDFVIKSDGELFVGKGHYHLSGNADKVKSAGRIVVKNGKIEYLDNHSGHYLPKITNTIEVSNIFRQNNLIGEGFLVFKT